LSSRAESLQTSFSCHLREPGGAPRLTHTRQVRLPRVLARLLGRDSAADAHAARHAAAENLERTTQAHYRSVTGTDASGRSTESRPDRPRDSK
jgi:hypothetical protein